MTVYGAKGKALELEPAIKTGGEGSIHKIKGYPDMLVKLYTDPAQLKTKEKKIYTMLHMAKSSAFTKVGLERYSTWPMGAVYDSKRNFLGYGMAKCPVKCDLKAVEVYPSQAGSLNLKDKLQVLINLCNLMERLHRAGIVIGDLNPENFLVMPDLSVCLVDTDSLHICCGSDLFPCTACAEGLLAPELSRKVRGTTFAALKGTTFTKETDRFALAVHIFTVLMNCHPFAYRKTANSSYNKSTARCIEDGESPFFRKVTGIATPAFALELTDIPHEVRVLFEKCFKDGRSSPTLRPTAAEWANALAKMKAELVICDKNRTHMYHRSLGRCPHCKAQRVLDNMNKSNGITIRHRATSPAANHAPAAATRAAVPITAPAPAAASATPAASSAPLTNAGHKFSFPFWAVTLVVSAVAMYLLSLDVLPQCWYWLLGSEEYIRLGTISSCVSGMLGCGVFNLFWAPGIKTGRHSLWEYTVSPLCAVGFSGGCLAAVAAVALLLVILGMVLIITFIIILCSD